jgi:hypothetical protein
VAPQKGRLLVIRVRLSHEPHKTVLVEPAELVDLEYQGFLLEVLDGKPSKEPKAKPSDLDKSKEK